jgi:hypothetical protein
MKTHTLILAAILFAGCQETKCLDDKCIHNLPSTEGESVDSLLIKQCQESGVDYNTIGTTTDPTDEELN